VPVPLPFFDPEPPRETELPPDPDPLENVLCEPDREPATAPPADPDRIFAWAPVDESPGPDPRIVAPGAVARFVRPPSVVGGGFPRAPWDTEPQAALADALPDTDGSTPARHEGALSDTATRVGSPPDPLGGLGVVDGEVTDPGDWPWAGPLERSPSAMSETTFTTEVCAAAARPLVADRTPAARAPASAACLTVRRCLPDLRPRP
jgi:hypothetical protein